MTFSTKLSPAPCTIKPRPSFTTRPLFTRPQIRPARGPPNAPPLVITSDFERSSALDLSSLDPLDRRPRSAVVKEGRGFIVLTPARRLEVSDRKNIAITIIRPPTAQSKFWPAIAIYIVKTYESAKLQSSISRIRFPTHPGSVPVSCKYDIQNAKLRAQTVPKVTLAAARQA